MPSFVCLFFCRNKRHETGWKMFLRRTHTSKTLGTQLFHIYISFSCPKNTKRYYTVEPWYEVYLGVEKRFHEWAKLIREIFFPLEDKLHIFKPTCNFFLLHRYECFENKKKKKKLDEKQRKKNGITPAISSLVRIWKISHSRVT